MSVIWQAAAQADIVRLIRHIAEENPFASRKVARELILAGDSLAVFPRRGRPGRIAGTRELVAAWPYIIVYEVDGSGHVVILRVWHGAQSRVE
ncbi:putative toxin Y4kP [Candidatus Terasakiella magnetica]|nr:putative toxin Y4kP [Candidatus Terasakiella magnetica]